MIIIEKNKYEFPRLMEKLSLALADTDTNYFITVSDDKSIITVHYRNRALFDVVLDSINNPRFNFNVMGEKVEFDSLRINIFISALEITKHFINTSFIHKELWDKKEES